MEQEKKQPSISGQIAGLMIGTAFFFDVLKALLEFTIFLPTLIDIFAVLTFFWWLRIYGIRFTPWQAAGFWTTFLVELVPFLNALPLWTGIIVIIALKSKAKAVLPTGVQKAIEISEGARISAAQLRKR